MSTCRRTALIGSCLVALGLALHCGPTQDCLRYSDCADGLTCAAGRCVPPPAPEEGDGSGKPGESADAAAEAASYPYPDAASDAGEDRGALDAPSGSDAADACVGCSDAEAGQNDSSPSDATADDAPSGE